jgi:hypothetical protein
MNLAKALSKSNCREARLMTPRGDRHAKKTASGIRIVKGVTDPTVVRKLTSKELASEDWQPITDWSVSSL